MILSFIICTFNRAGYLRKCIYSIINQKNINFSEIEIIIIDNNSSDNTKDLVQELKENFKQITIKYYVEKNQGLSFARNTGIIFSNGEWLAFIDDDAYLIDNYTYSFFSILKKIKNVVAFGGPILLDFESSKPVWYNNYIASVWGYFYPYKNSQYFKTNVYPRGSNMIIKKDIFIKYGYFNTNLGRKGNILIGGEEKEFFLRIKQNKQNKFFYDTSLIIFHSVPNERNNLNYIKKQSINIGYSEKIRVKNNPILIIKKIFEELYKIIGTFFLSSIFLLKGNYSKSIIILKLRFWIIKGLTIKKEIL